MKSKRTRRAGATETVGVSLDAVIASAALRGDAVYSADIEDLERLRAASWSLYKAPLSTTACPLDARA